MKVTKNYVFIFIILCFATQTASSMHQMKFYLNQKDQLRLPIEEFLDYYQNISSLSYQTQEEIQVNIPQPAEKIKLELLNVSGLTDTETKHILSSASFENFSAKLCLNEQNQKFILIDQFNETQNSVELLKNNKIDLQGQNCNSVQMDDTNIYVGCYSYFMDSLLLCIQDYKQQDSQMECQIVYEGEEREQPIFQNQKLHLDIFTNSENTVVMMYIENSDQEQFKNHVILYHEGMTQMMSINKKGLNIKKIQLIDFKQQLQSYSFLVLNQLQENKAELFYYKYEATKAKSSEVVSIESEKIIDYFLIGSKILIFKKVIDQHVEIFEMTEFDIFSRKERVYDLQDFFAEGKNVQLQEILKYDDSIIIAVQENTESENVVNLMYLYYDFQTQRINKFSAGLSNGQNLMQQQIRLSEQNYLYIAYNDENTLYHLSHCRYVTIKALNEIKKGNVVFSYEQDQFFNIDLVYVNEHENVDFTKTQKQMLQNSPNYNPIRQYSNNPDKEYQSNVEFVNEAKLEEDIYQDLDICDHHNIKMVNNMLLDFCNSGILDFHYLTLEKEMTNNKETLLLKKYGHQSIMPQQDLSNDDLGFDVSNVYDYTIVFKDIVLMLAKGNNIFYYNIKSYRQKLELIKLEENMQNCHIEFNKVICEQDDSTVILSFRYIDSILQIKEEKVINVKKQFVTISQVKKDYIAYLVKYPETQHYNLIGQTDVKDIDVKIPDEYVNETTQLYEVSEDNYVLMTEVDDHLVLIGIKNSSIIIYPNQNLVYYQIIGIKTTQHSNYFMLVYQQISRQIAFVIYNSSYQSLHRLITSQTTNIETKENLEYSIQDLDETNLLIHIGEKEGLKNHEFFVFRKNGPLIINTQKKTDINYGTEKNPKIIKNEIHQFESHLKIKMSQLGLEKDENIVNKNLEELSVIEIDGDYMQVVQPKNQKGFYIQDRLTTVKKNYLIKESQMIKQNFNIQSNVEKQTLSLNFNQSHYRGNRVSNNKSYDECIVVSNSDVQKSQDEQKIHFYLCKENINKLFVLTNFDDQSIKLANLDSALKPSKAFITFNDQEQFHLIISLDYNHHDIVIYEFNLSEKVYEVSREYFFNSNQLNDQFEPYNNFYAVFNQKNNSISLMFNSQFDDYLHIFEYSLIEKLIKLKEMQKVHLLLDQQQNLLSIEFKNQTDYIECVIATEISVVLLYLKSTKGNGWNINTGIQKTIKTGLKLEHPKISIIDQYIALLVNKDETSTNILIWKKDNSDYIYYGLQIVEFAVNTQSPKFQIFIENMHLRENENSQYLDVIYLQRNLSDAQQQGYDSLILQTFELKQFSISLDKSLVDLNGIQLEFQRLQPQGFITQQLLIKSDEQKKVILHTAMVILLILVVVLALIAQGVWNKNKELQEELKKDLRERDMASERV